MRHRFTRWAWLSFVITLALGVQALNFVAIPGQSPQHVVEADDMHHGAEAHPFSVAPETILAEYDSEQPVDLCNPSERDDCDPAELGAKTVPPSGRSYTDQPIQDLTVWRSNDGDPKTGEPTCQQDYPYVFEVPVYNETAVVAGRVVACSAFHAQNNPNHVGIAVGDIGKDGTRRPQIAQRHYIVTEIPNPQWGSKTNPINGRYLHYEGTVDVFTIAIGSGGEVWYTKTEYPGVGGIQIGQDKTPIYPQLLPADVNGQRHWGAYVTSNSSFSLNTCYGPATRRPGDETRPCAKYGANGITTSQGKAVWFNPNLRPEIPHDWLGHRMVGAIPWQSGVCMPEALNPPTMRDGEAKIHSWLLNQYSRVYPVRPASCSQPAPFGDRGIFPTDGYYGSDNPQAQPTATIGQPTPTPAPTATSTPTSAPNATATPTPTDVPPTPTDTATPVSDGAPIVLHGAAAEYWANDSFSGDSVVQREEPLLDVDWADGSPDPLVPSDHFSATFAVAYTGSIGAFVVRSDDGLRIFVDDLLMVDRWDSPPYGTTEVRIGVQNGDHTIRVEYRELTGDARLRVALLPIVSTLPTATATSTSPPATATATDVPTQTATAPAGVPSAPPATGTTQTPRGDDPEILTGGHFEWITNDQLQGGARFISDEPVAFNWLGRAAAGQTGPKPGIPWTFSFHSRAHWHSSVSQVIANCASACRLWIDGKLVFDTVTGDVQGPFKEQVFTRLADGRKLIDVFKDRGAYLEWHMDYVSHGPDGRVWVYFKR